MRLLLMLLLACTWVAPVRAADFDAAQEALYAAMKRQKAIDPELRLVTLRYVCSLEYAKRRWPVVDSVEQVRGAVVPRAFNRILVLDQKLKLRKIVPYADQTPRFCKGNQLFVQGELGIDNAAPYGNVLSFSDNGDVSVSKIDVNDLPIPLTGDRKTYFLK
jgi:hypothetical protein